METTKVDKIVNFIKENKKQYGYKSIKSHLENETVFFVKLINIEVIIFINRLHKDNNQRFRFTQLDIKEDINVSDLGIESYIIAINIAKEIIKLNIKELLELQSKLSIELTKKIYGKI